MSRRRGAAGPEISLFPFLAVLLCTMGSLLVLLVLFSRSAQRSDEAAVADAARRQEEELTLARDELAWRLDQLRGVRERTAADLASARLQLAGVEDGAREMVDEIESLERTAAALAGEADQGDAGEQSLEELEGRLAEAKREVDAAREAAADRPPAYAVVPYEGPAGTHRRPLYIECSIDGVFLQPEGIRLGPGDFEGPPGPGNPLASALRAAREHLASGAGESGDPAVQPYPLLLVRPSGVMAYYAAREALQSWGSDFGYQFIDEDWTLSFPPADPTLAEVETRAIEEARRRLEWLAQVRPRQRSKPAVQYRASTTRGGVVATNGPTVLGDQSRWDWKDQQSQAGRGFRAGAAGGDAILGGSVGAGGAAEGGGQPGGGSSPANNGGQGGFGDRYLGPSKFYGGSGDATAAADGGEAEGRPGGRRDDQLAEGDVTGEGADTSQGTLAGGETTGVAGDPAGEASGVSGAAASALAGSASSGTAAGGGGSAGSGSGRSDGSAATSGGGGTFGASLPGMRGGDAAVGASVGDPASASCPVAERRGSNWASLASSDRPIPLTRPIRLECAADEFRLLGTGGRVMARVPIGSRTADAVDPLVREVHATVGSWGMAGDKMYWRPELVLSATADGGGRRDDLERLLADSGLDTRRAGETDAVRKLPPVQRTGGVPRTR